MAAPHPNCGCSTRGRRVAPRREVVGQAHQIAVEARRLQGLDLEAGIEHRHFVGGQGRFDTRQQRQMQRRFRGLRRLRPDDGRRQGDALSLDPADARNQPDDDGGQRFASLGMIVLTLAVPQLGAPERRGIDRFRRIAIIAGFLPLVCGQHVLTPGAQQGGDVPIARMQGGPGAAHRWWHQPHGLQSRKHGPAARQQGAAHEHPHEM
jgi:hypothetical protein